MQEMKDDHRGHSILARISGAGFGHFVGSFTVWKIEPNNSYRGVLQGVSSQSFGAAEEACAAAMWEAKELLDAVLDKQVGWAAYRLGSNAQHAESPQRK